MEVTAASISWLASPGPIESTTWTVGGSGWRVMRGMSPVCGHIRAGDRGDLQVAAHCADLLGQGGEADVGDELQPLAQGLKKLS